MFRVLGHPVSTPRYTMDYLLPAYQNTQICFLLLMASMFIVCLQNHLFNLVLMDMQAASSFCYYKQPTYILSLCISTKYVIRRGMLALRPGTYCPSTPQRICTSLSTDQVYLRGFFDRNVDFPMWHSPAPLTTSRTDTEKLLNKVKPNQMTISELHVRSPELKIPTWGSNQHQKQV